MLALQMQLVYLVHKTMIASVTPRRHFVLPALEPVSLLDAILPLIALPQLRNVLTLANGILTVSPVQVTLIVYLGQEPSVLLVVVLLVLVWLLLVLWLPLVPPSPQFAKTQERSKPAVLVVVLIMIADFLPILPSVVILVLASSLFAVPLPTALLPHLNVILQDLVTQLVLPAQRILIANRSLELFAILTRELV
jgi:hypothetical protein